MENLEELLNELQLQNQQLQTILIQKQSLMIQGKEVERALEEIEKGGEEIYRSVGPILVKTNREDIKKDLEEDREETEIKINSLDKQEIRIRKRIKEIQEKFQEFTRTSKGG
jgi:prefoldin beta subunit